MRKPNYDFERSQREKAKELKAQAKAQKKLEKAAAAEEAAGPAGEGTEDAEERPGRA
ncbi:hypothetical protein [Muricoccus aerilatus]|uniref:hypothetical protein n=1 Tax=Muricoccus aerilatus TaxID=452982 RepID=UPI000AE072AF|nr:hypothetical protein [Roseomonas aerilata]